MLVNILVTIELILFLTLVVSARKRIEILEIEVKELGGKLK